MIRIPNYFISKNHVVVKEQNLKIICDGNDEKYHSNEFEYDYIKNALTIAKITAQKKLISDNVKESAACFKVAQNTYFIVYVNSQKENNPYFALYDTKTKEYYQTSNISNFNCFRKEIIIRDLRLRLEQSLSKQNLILPDLYEKMSKIADDYDNELEL